MSTSHDLGTLGETIATEYLMGKGYKILERNWRFQKKEVDIIAEIDNTLVIVEVKSRNENHIEEPKEAVKRQKQKNVVEAADAYIQKNEIDLEARFDVISLIFYNFGDYDLEHIEDAFYPLVK